MGVSVSSDGLALRSSRAAGLALLLALPGTASAQWSPRPLPDTTDGIHVFNDRVYAWTPGQVEFAAKHYAGTAKLTRAEADAMRAVNPGLVVLHYRLGLSIGYRTSIQNCDQDGNWMQLIDGDWVQEWPGDANVPDAWHFQYAGLPVYMCHWSWWLMDVARPGFRSWWTTSVNEQIANNDADGVFADSFLVPNFLSTTGYDPDLPGYDPVLEALWMAKLDDWMDYIRTRIHGAYLIPNPGMWVTTRDETDYSKADGLFIEGFASDPWANWGFAGWQTQLDRLLPLIADDKIVIAYSTHTWNAERRMFVLGSYLAIKGARTYVDLELSEAAEWWPEYEIPIGAPVDALAGDVTDLWDPALGVFKRRYTNGLVLVNPGDHPASFTLPQSGWLAQPEGGGVVPDNGELPGNWRVNYTEVSQLTLDHGAAAILLTDPDPHRLSVDPMVSGQHVELTARGGRPNEVTWFFVTRSGEAQTPFPQLGVTLGLANPRPIGVVPTNNQGVATDTMFPQPFLAGTTLWFQAAQAGSTTQVVERLVY